MGSSLGAANYISRPSGAATLKSLGNTGIDCRGLKHSVLCCLENDNLKMA